MSGDLHYRRFVAKCADRVRVCDQSKHSVETLLIIPQLKQLIAETRAERGGERRVCAYKLPPIFVVADLHATGTNVGFYLGRKYFGLLVTNSIRLLFAPNPVGLRKVVKLSFKLEATDPNSNQYWCIFGLGSHLHQIR